MSASFTSPLAVELRAFLRFKRNLGYRYARAEYTLQEFDRFLVQYKTQCRPWRLDRAILAWLATKRDCKPRSLYGYTNILRQFCQYLRRTKGNSRVHEPLWPRFRTTSTYTPYILTADDIKCLLNLSAELTKPPFRAAVYRALLLVLYCTGLRFGEAVRLRIRDIDTRSAILFVEESKGRSRWVPFHRSLARELDKYLVARRTFSSAQRNAHLFVGANRRPLRVKTASETIRRLLWKAGLKPLRGREGPRPYDLRRAFAVHRLEKWYHQGVDLHARLPWLSAYMGHDNIMGTEVYLTATSTLMKIASARFRRRYLYAGQGRS